jgi:hypothetical protein
VRDDFALTVDGRARFETKYNPYYPVAKRSVAFLRAPGSVPGPIQVIGDFDLQYQSGRALAVAVTGNTVEELDDRLWRRMRRELRVVRPPYLFIVDDGDDLMRVRSPQTSKEITHDFCRLHRAPDGWWYARRSNGECAAGSRPAGS